jgi:hypothetical protein
MRRRPCTCDCITFCNRGWLPGETTSKRNGGNRQECVGCKTVEKHCLSSWAGLRAKIMMHDAGCTRVLHIFAPIK